MMLLVLKSNVCMIGQVCVCVGRENLLNSSAKYFPLAKSILKYPNVGISCWKAALGTVLSLLQVGTSPGPLLSFMKKTECF